MKLPVDLYRCEQVKALDQAAIERLKIDGFELMQRAGKACFDYIALTWPDSKDLIVYCGGGNNGGDGYVIAALAKHAGLSVRVIAVKDPLSLQGSAKKAHELAMEHGVTIVPFSEQLDAPSQGLIVDALLGIGLSGAVRGDSAAAIAQINSTNCPVLAVDIPSGICGDTGSVLGCAVQADATMTFIGVKQGLITGEARSHCGDIVFASLSVTDDVYSTQVPSAQRLKFTPPLLPSRPINSHKGLFGRLIVVAGDYGFGGAGIMAAEAALHTGAGLVSLATRAEHVSPALARRPELMVLGIERASELEPLLSQAEVLVLGPGIGRSEWSKSLLHTALVRDIPTVLDADGLNSLASELNYLAPRDNWVLTPHPAEAARLLACSTAQVQADRFTAATQLQKRYGGVVVLKGAGTLVADAKGVSVCTAGNPAMSTPGMGDVLSGIIGGLIAQGLSISEATKLGVWAHATAADQSLDSKHLLATEVYTHLRGLW